MTRQIRVDQIDDVFKDAVQKLVRKTTLQWTTLSKKATPVVSGNLRNGWKTNIGKYRATIINNVEYAEPVIFGTPSSLPPSWGGQFRTSPKQNTIKGFTILQAKQLTVRYIPNELRKIIRRG